MFHDDDDRNSITFPKRNGAAYVCTLPDGLGRVKKLRYALRRMLIVETESGVTFIARLPEGLAE